MSEKQKKTGYLSVRVDSELMNNFKNYCEKHGYTQAKVFRNMIMQLLKEQEASK